MKRILLILVFILLPGFCHAQEDVIPPERKEFFNRVLRNIYDDILAAKPRYRELADFDENVLSRNKYGIYQIVYAKEIMGAGGKVSRYAFAVTIDTRKDNTFPSQEGSFVYPFPFLGFQFSGYLEKHPVRRQFDLVALLDKYLSTSIQDYQQPYMPLRLEVIPSQEVYKVKESIAFEVVVTNTSKKNILVKNLSKETLYFTINNEYWGIEQDDSIETDPKKRARQLKRQQKAEMRLEKTEQRENRLRRKDPRGKKTTYKGQLILYPGEALSMRFTGLGYIRPKDLNMHALYRMKVEGLNPTTALKLKVVSEDVPADSDL